jgi:tetratricopeptide (TPR) repeat protein
MKPVSIKIKCAICGHGASMSYMTEYETDNDNPQDNFSINNTDDLVYPEMTSAMYEILKKDHSITGQVMSASIVRIEKHRVGGLLSEHCRLSEKFFKVFNYYFIDHENKTGGYTYRLIEEMLPASTIIPYGNITFISKNDEMKKKVDELMNAGYYKDVIQIMNKELLENPKDNHNLFFKGEALLALEYYNDAIVYYDMILDTEPNSSLSLISKGVALRHLERYEEAVDCYDKALEIESNNDEVIATVLSSKGVALRYLERYEEAVDCYDKALKIESGDFKIWCNKGTTLLALERNEEAVDCYDKALEIEPDEPHVIEIRNTAIERIEEMK